MGLVTLPYTLVNGAPNDADQLMADFNAVVQVVNGSIDSSNVDDDSLRWSDMATGSNGLAAGAFSAWLSASPGVVTPDAFTPLTLGTEEFDVSGWFNTTNGRFTPQVAGYYQFDWAASAAAAMSVGKYWRSVLLKNGSPLKIGATLEQAGINDLGSSGATVAQANGSGDYFQLGIQASGAVAPATGATLTYLSGHLIGRS